MREDNQRTYYTGVPLGNGECLVATFVSNLTAPDELPYMTHQMRFDADAGFVDDLWFEDDFITSYAGSGKPLALSREGRLFDAISGSQLVDLDPAVTTHFNTMSTNESTLCVAGDNGRFWAGRPDDMVYLANEVHRPLPSPTSALEEKIAWGQRMQQVFTCLVLGPREYLIGGARGFLTFYRDGTFTPIALPLEAHVTGLARNSDGTIMICGHSPVSFVGTLDNNNKVIIGYSQRNGPRFHSPCVFQGNVLVAASGGNNGVFSITNDTLSRFEIAGSSDFGPLRCIVSDATRLWSIFEDMLVVTEGDITRLHRHPPDL